MSESAIFSAARAAVTSELRSAKDWSDNPADPKVNRRPAFLVTLTREGAEPAAMGSPLEEVDLLLTVEVFAAYDHAEAGRNLVRDMADAASATLKASSDLRALTDRMVTTGLEVDLAGGENRIARATLEITLEATL
ncbi:MAG: hypothetical protein AAFY65_13255 [Pseudomonadota bacterium]